MCKEGAIDPFSSSLPRRGSSTFPGGDFKYNKLGDSETSARERSVLAHSDLYSPFHIPRIGVIVMGPTQRVRDP